MEFGDNRDHNLCGMAYRLLIVDLMFGTRCDIK